MQKQAFQKTEMGEASHFSFSCVQPSSPAPLLSLEVDTIEFLSFHLRLAINVDVGHKKGAEFRKIIHDISHLHKAPVSQHPLRGR